MSNKATFYSVDYEDCFPQAEASILNPCSATLNYTHCKLLYRLLLYTWIIIEKLFESRTLAQWHKDGSISTPVCPSLPSARPIPWKLLISHFKFHRLFRFHSYNPALFLFEISDNIPKGEPETRDWRPETRTRTKNI